MKVAMMPFVILYYMLESLCFLIIPIRHKDVRGQIVLITGAGSGIGQKMCVQFAKLGCKVVGVDVSAAGLMSTEELLGKQGLESGWSSYKCDLCDRKQVYEVATAIKSEVGDVDILVNNAGIVTGGNFLDCKDESMMKTMDVNATAHFWTLKAFLPRMIERDHGHVVTVASGAGLLGMPRLVDYCASKFAAVGMSEALLMELRHRKKNGVHVTIVCPYYIDTGMFKGVQSRLVPIMQPDDAVSRIMDGVLKNKSHVIMPLITQLAYALRNLVPTKVLVYLGESLEILSTMENFRGRE